MAQTLNEIIATAQSKGYTIDKRPYKLNLIGVRNSAATDQQKFDDQIAYFYYDNNGKLIGKVATGTTDPSTYFLNVPMNPKGAAILQSGEYKDTWQIGLHRGKYKALVQVKPVTVIRDDDRNSYINYFAPTQTGLFGINIHRASLVKNNVTEIGQDSAGCQVFQNASDFNSMMGMAETSRSKYGNKFSYILIDQRDTVKLRNTTLLFVGLGILGYAAYLFLKKPKN
jgi:hypothetical protein